MAGRARRRVVQDLRHVEADRACLQVQRSQPRCRTARRSRRPSARARAGWRGRRQWGGPGRGTARRSSAGGGTRGAGRSWRRPLCDAGEVLGVERPALARDQLHRPVVQEAAVDRLVGEQEGFSRWAAGRSTS
jgi:hypothetical protein